MRDVSRAMMLVTTAFFVLGYAMMYALHAIGL